MNDPPYRSLGHPPGHYLAQVRVSPEAREAFLALGPATELPAGAVVAQFQRDPSQSRPVAVFIMVKQTRERWEFLALETDGTVRESDDTALCERCHAEATGDYLFGLPRAGQGRDAGMR